jgi:hypothetical protein
LWQPEGKETSKTPQITALKAKTRFIGGLYHPDLEYDEPVNSFLFTFVLLSASPAPESPEARDPLARDPMAAKTFSMIAPGMGHYYNGNIRKMRKHQRRFTLALIPFAGGFTVDVLRNPLEGVDQFRDLSVKKFPWFTLGGMILSGVFVQRVREADAEEAYTDALRLGMGFEEESPSP